MEAAAINTAPISADMSSLNAELAKRKQIEFMDYTWQLPQRLIRGRHTVEVADILDQAMDQIEQANRDVEAAVKEGMKEEDAVEKYSNRSVFLVVKLPFRHGKSDLISRYFPPRYLARNPYHETCLASYNDDLAFDMSRFARRIMRSHQFQDIYPDIRISKDSHSVKTWGVIVRQIDKKTGKERWVDAGKTQWSGIGGSFTGKGYHLGIIDDFLRNRKDAESKTIRDAQWEWFTNVFMTRRAPVSITIILATPWNIDDIIGRIQKKRDPRNEDYDPEFPEFKFVTYGAEDQTRTKYPSGYLFPERFPASWYRQQRATLGKYAAAGLLDCNPVKRGGNLLKTDMIQIIDEEKLPKDLRWVRCWDVASTEKQRTADRPDYTVGALVAVKKVLHEQLNIRVPVIYIKHLIRGQWEAPERNRKIRQASQTDGPGVRIGIEAIAGYKDTYTTIRDELRGVAVVEKVPMPGDKIIRAEPLEAPFEAGNVYFVKSAWNRPAIDEIEAFPNGENDDIVDAISGAYAMTELRSSGLSTWEGDGKGSSQQGGRLVRKYS